MNGRTRSIFFIAVLMVGVFLVACSQDYDYPESTGERPQAGNANATVIVQEFSDFQCPYCSSAHGTVERLIDEYGDRVKFEYRHFPLPAHSYAQKAAEAAECANDQGQFWAYADTLFKNQNALSVSNMKGFAADLGLDTEAFNACLDSGAKAAIVKADQQDGIASQVRATPTFFINGQKIEGAQPYSVFKDAIEANLE